MNAMSMMQAQWMPSKKQVGQRLCWERCKGGYFSADEKYALTVTGHSEGKYATQAGTVITTGESSITVPRDLYTGDVWTPALGKIVRQDGSVESTPVQNLFADRGTVKVWQEIDYGYPAILSATVAVARAEEAIDPDRGIPAAYQRLPYLGSTGGQYLDTEIEGGSDAGYRIRFDTVDDPNAVQDTDCYFGGASESTLGRLLLTWLYGYGYVTFEKRDGATTLAREDLLPLGASAALSVSSSAVICNGESIPLAGNLPQSGWGDLSWYLFSSHEEPQRSAKMKLYGLVMTEDGGSRTVREFIPCRRIADGELGLYDTVSRRFFMNIGTGSFTVE